MGNQGEVGTSEIKRWIEKEERKMAKKGVMTVPTASTQSSARRQRVNPRT